MKIKIILFFFFTILLGCKPIEPQRFYVYPYHENGFEYIISFNFYDDVKKQLPDSLKQKTIVIERYYFKNNINESNARKTKRGKEIYEKIIAFSNLNNLSIKNANLSDFSLIEGYTDIYLNPKNTDTLQLKNQLNIKDDQLYLVPIISEELEIYNGFTNNCVYISFYIMDRNNIYYQKTGYICKSCDSHKKDWRERIREISDQDYEFFMDDFMKDLN